jgi:hypothetical protein
MTCTTLVCTILFTLHNFYLYDGIHKLQAVSEQRITHGKVIVGEDKQCVCVCVCVCVVCVTFKVHTHSCCVVVVLCCVRANLERKIISILRTLRSIMRQRGQIHSRQTKEKHVKQQPI